MADGNRYSTTVAWMKVALPLVALALLSTLFLFSRAPDPEAALPYADVDVAQLVREQRLSRPRFAGTMEDGRAVTLVADTATAAAENPNTILMTAIESQVALSDADEVLLSADEGEFSLAEQVITLAGSVLARTTTGVRISTDQLIVAMDAMRLTAPGAVSLAGDGVSIDAGAMEMTGPEEATFLRFTGGVRLLYQPQN